MSVIGIAAGTAFDTVKTKIGTEVLNKFGITDSPASWGESFAASGAVNAYEAFTGNEMGFMSKMVMTQALSYGIHKFNGIDSEGGGMLNNLGLGGLAAGGISSGTSLFSKMGKEGGQLSEAFDGLFNKINDYSEKFLGEDNIISNAMSVLGIEKEKGSKLTLKNEDAMSKMFDGMDADSLLSKNDDVNESVKRRKLMTPEFKLN